MFAPMIYQGGVYQHNKILELVEDLGGYLIQKNEMQTEVSLNLFVPKEDIGLLEAKANALKGELKYAPLAGTDILLVIPSLAFHHMPHPSCDIAEYLRREGATTTLIGLSRGVGKRIAQIKESEKKLIEEYDIAIFVMGIFDACIIEKEEKLLEDINIPTLVTGGPERLNLRYANSYVGGIGRINHRLKKEGEIKKLDDVLTSVIRLVEERRENIAKDPLIIEPPKIMYEIENQVSDIKDVVSPSPISIQIDGLRVKLPYNEYNNVINEIRFDDEGYKLGEIAAIKPSLFRQSILIKVRPISDITTI
ncbi:MAG: methanogenesis marker 7 protein [Candidatus Methanoliparum thermophilum]|uniref:Methanogenesis marker 7 protein n=1 Tax=Methanoliparum thermophilum TaxID=2491083 RepID=A0A520KT16_METT2|nr:methanogenesis marker 7 protein [Candidatus Methanoliparum sp. LAM-1]RZN65024.1 MAG: methanogenesis marker 7 protein [Candidatus Methanoliparum thermophilum]BDC36089.1 methanogenesis marker 7 protein [Candidatus Methanoliparum sp. LAM-1]